MKKPKDKYYKLILVDLYCETDSSVINKIMQEDINAIFQMRFPQKLWYLLHLHTDAILWGGTGRTILLNYHVLHNYLQCNHSIFKTTNISSFVRQLNLYGFRKVTSHLQDPMCNSSNPYMHEYVHDYFQFRRPELLNKITRKALAIKRNFKPKSLYNNVEQLLYLSPLQKARRGLRIALKKAAQDLFEQNSSKPVYSKKIEYEDSQDDFCEDEENIELDWFMPSSETAPELILPATANEQDHQNNITKDNGNYRDSIREGLLSFTEDSSQPADSFPVEFLNMPELDNPRESSSPELLAEFNIDNNPNVIKNIGHKETDHNFLNCVLPSIRNDQNDDDNVSMAEKNNVDDGEWDQMFSEMMTNRGPNQECASDLKELYSQISKTIDLLNS